ncbi:MAG: nucleotide sugar dehydrogenase [Nitrososphaerota archaeon]|nr:nucleotide sugar dehydrogenase [Candidatus Bathyarchaeota archaeon]MDW8049434.1 nucleotide sugar dehydrogenase [Nitrososphaerota archaeon]
MDLDDVKERGRYVVTVVGCGRMGLPTACLFADAGFRVFCLDKDVHLVSQINNGVCPFEEPGLENLLKKNLGVGRIKATADPKDAIPMSDFIVIAVNILIDKNGRPDYSSLEESCRSIGLNIKRGALVIVESTLPPSTTDTVIKPFLESISGLKAGVDFGLAYSPIRARVGRTIRDILSYPKIVAGIDKESLAVAKAFLGTIARGGVVEVEDIRTAEAVKLFENVYRYVNIALANELARLCEKVGIDYLKAQEAANTQPYCHLLRPGLVGGHLPKDCSLLFSEAEELGVRLPIASAAQRVNEGVVKHACLLVKDALAACGKSLRRSKIAVLGVSFRANVKEARGTLVPDLIDLLNRRGANVVVFDPHYSFSELRSMGYPAERTFSRVIHGADCLLIAVGHTRFKRLSLGKIGVSMRKPAAIVDLANILDLEMVKKEGFIYRGLGRGSVHA